MYTSLLHIRVPSFIIRARLSINYSAQISQNGESVSPQKIQKNDNALFQNDKNWYMNNFVADCFLQSSHRLSL